MALAAILIKLQGSNPITAYKSLFKTAFGSAAGIGATLGKSTPLVLSGLAVAVGLRAGLFNIGAQGQFIFGAVAASYVGFRFELPLVIHALAALAAAMIFAGLWGGLVGFLKARTGAHEVIVTIMFNYISIYFDDILSIFTIQQENKKFILSMCERKKSIIMKKKRRQFSEMPEDVNQTMNQSIDQPQFRQ